MVGAPRCLDQARTCGSPGEDHADQRDHDRDRAERGAEGLAPSRVAVHDVGGAGREPREQLASAPAGREPYEGGPAYQVARVAAWLDSSRRAAAPPCRCYLSGVATTGLRFD